SCRPCGRANRFLWGERQRIDAVECPVRARAQQHLQPRDDARTPGLGRFERDQTLFEFFSCTMAVHRDEKRREGISVPINLDWELDRDTDHERTSAMTPRTSCSPGVV